MSYDVSIGGSDFNYTYNVSALFYDHIPDTGKGGGLRELDGVTGRAACRILSDAFERINRTKNDLWLASVVGEPHFCRRYDSSSGWGSTVGAILFLACVLAACAEHPRKRVRVC